MRLGIIFVLSSFFSSVFAQTDFYEKYYPHIDKAEQSFVREDYPSAIAAYSEAFKSVEQPLARDIYNGIVCYFLTGDIDGAKPWLLLLAKKGIDPLYLENQVAIQEDPIWDEWQKFKPIYLQVQSEFKPKPSESLQALTQKINNDLKEIQSIYLQLPDSAFDEDSVSKKTSLVDSLLIAKSMELVDKIYEEISFEAAIYIVENGVPAEDVMGISNENLMADALKTFLSNSRFYSNLFSSIKDEYGDYTKLELISQLNEKLIDEVGKGNVHRDFVLEIVKDEYSLEYLSFLRVGIPKEIGCKDAGEHLYVRPKLKSVSRYFDFLLGENEEVQIEKGKYSIFKNEVFLMNEVATLEELVVDSCQQLETINKELIQIDY